MKTIKKSILLSALILSASIIQAQTVNADTISTGSGNRIHFINTKANSGSDAILLESNGHYALIKWIRFPEPVEIVSAFTVCA